MNKQPKITLVGAGLGDPDLLSISGMLALQIADVVLYDALVNPVLLQHTRQDCRHVYVGKRLGHYAFRQDEINTLLVAEALAYGHVVRLKGGDPYIFGRGNEELQFAQAKGIAVDVIPGVSSSLAVADLVNIPLIYDGLSDNFWVITASTKSGRLSKDVAQAARMDITAVILMGMHHLSEIVKIYKEFGRQDISVAIIQNGSLPQQKMAIGKMANIEKEVAVLQLANPAVIIIGRTVGIGTSYLNS